MTRQTPNWLQQGSYAASVDRRLPGMIWPTAACYGGVVTVSSGMTVNIAVGSIAVPTANNTGTAVCCWDAVEQCTLAAAPASGSNRYDLVVCQLRGNDIDGGANNDFLFVNVTGTAAATPTVPAVPNNAVAVAQIYVPGGSASIAGGNITDVRPYQFIPAGEIAYGSNTTALGGITTSGLEIVGVTTNIVPGRRYRITASVRGISSTVDGDIFAFYILAGATNIREQLFRSVGVSLGQGGQNVVARWASTTTVGAVRFGLNVVRIAGSGTGSLATGAGPGQLNEITVENIA